MAFFDLAGQTAIVTGGAQGIGEGIVHRLANSGAQVAVADKSFDGARAVAEQLQSNGLKGFPIAVDVADRTSVEAMVEEVLARNEKIDILINNAGIAGRAAPVWEQGDEDWQRVLDVNLTSVFFCCRAVMPHMIRRDYGRVVNIASLAGKEGNPNMVGLLGYESRCDCHEQVNGERGSHPQHLRQRREPHRDPHADTEPVDRRPGRVYDLPDPAG